MDVFGECGEGKEEAILAFVLGHVELASSRLIEVGNAQRRPVGVDASALKAMVALLQTHGSVAKLTPDSGAASTSRLLVTYLLRILKRNLSSLGSGSSALTEAASAALYAQLREYLSIDLSTHTQCATVCSTAGIVLASGSNLLLRTPVSCAQAVIDGGN